jgi:hypothetical protein
MKGLAPHPGLITQPTGQSTLVTQMDAYVCGGERHPPPSPAGTSNLQPVLCHAGVVAAQDWLTGELCVVVSPISWQRNLNLARRAPPQSLGGLWTLYRSAFGQVSMLLAAVGRTNRNLRCQGRSSG